MYFFPYLHQTTTGRAGNLAVVGCISFLIYIKPQLADVSYQEDLVVFLSLSTSNHNTCCIRCPMQRLYFFPYLHQTTTREWGTPSGEWLYFFPYLHQTTTVRRPAHQRYGCISFLIYIKPQLRIGSQGVGFCCISFLIYIKPQLPEGCPYNGKVVFLSLSTSNHNKAGHHIRQGPVVFLSLSTSNHNPAKFSENRALVVFLSLSTSNHNNSADLYNAAEVVFLSLSTSNHNLPANYRYAIKLYFFPYLHQTTTGDGDGDFADLLYFFPYLHQTTTPRDGIGVADGCISFLIYIKPQRISRTSSNAFRCISFLIYIKPQRPRSPVCPRSCCISFLIYIKPQRCMGNSERRCVVFLSLSTSNHNLDECIALVYQLYFFPYLHQTTTGSC